MKKLLTEIKSCTICTHKLPMGPRPIVSAHIQSKVIIIGQAPGLKVHESGIPWNDKSGENLRAWMGISKDDFYDPKKFAIVPMGFCYPGRGKSGDNPPTEECAPEWHESILNKIQNPALVILIGNYAQAYYLQTLKKKTLTETVKTFREYLPKYFVLPHPSPRNNIWMKKNNWFKSEVLPELKKRVKIALTSQDL